MRNRIQPGCGGGSVVGKVSPGPLKEREAIAAVLPQGVSFDSPVIPDVLYGESSNRTQRQGVKKGKSQKQKSKVPYTVIMLAN